MLETAAADRVEVLVVVDNVIDTLSLVPGYVENEWPWLTDYQQKQLRIPQAI
jgi:predicted nucleic acid-binding protein